MGNCFSPEVKNFPYAYPCAAKNTKVVYGSLARKMAIVSGTSFSQLETRLAHIFTLDSPFIVTYQDEAGHTVVIETTEELGFFISDGTGPSQLDVSLTDTSKEMSTTFNRFSSREKGSIDLKNDSNDTVARPMPAHTRPDSGCIYELSNKISKPRTSFGSLRRDHNLNSSSFTHSLCYKTERLKQLRRDCSDLVQQTFELDDINDIILDQIGSHVEIDLDVYENSLRRLTKPSACPSLALPSINLIYSSTSSSNGEEAESIECRSGNSMYF